MGWFWADQKTTGKDIGGAAVSSMSGCPVMHESSSSSSPPSSECPVMQGDNDRINPLNNMPELAASKQPGQKMDLPVDRTISSIPKSPDSNEFWEYPSPQQMYNAMVRKGKIGGSGEVAEDAVESMVQVHNFLNEGCWQEVLEWEKPHTDESHVQPKLLKFMGKPGVLSPRARWMHLCGLLFPSHFSQELPFDRHDWIVLRGERKAEQQPPTFKEVRYVLDFYGGPDDENGMPTFHVDVRPALDSLDNAKDRMTRFLDRVISGPPSSSSAP
ncbi:Cyc3p [Saccharomyces cerevisiae YJM1418]|nr:Cyc3p [Saccharomyces cerevisiae YJM1418]CAD6594820.1 HLJ1_G0049070.mRNA.1.CDS.1 [Saccharomyces cerevisiae]CAI4238931.1 CCN_G0000280.mRNA.1.CDS.1 [Saccharomyces cerevisiae]CAI7124899.1 CCN_G0000280.mRNA.1.CDS.1 [Saccharomyces cerevisiae]